MPEPVNEWIWGGSPGHPPNIPPIPDLNHQCESVNHPEINSTGPSQQIARDLFIGAWNTTNGTSLVESDFTFVPRPE